MDYRDVFFPKYKVFFFKVVSYQRSFWENERSDHFGSGKGTKFVSALLFDSILSQKDIFYHEGLVAPDNHASINSNSGLVLKIFLFLFFHFFQIENSFQRSFLESLIFIRRIHILFL